MLLRHGRTDLNRRGLLQGASDLPLDDVGRRQAVAAGAYVRRRWRIDKVVCSPRRRARETLTLAGFDEDVITDEIRAQEVPLPSPAGGLAVIDSQIFHRVGTNRTSGTRTSMTMGYVSVDELASVQDPYRVLVRGTSAYGGNVSRSMM